MPKAEVGSTKYIANKLKAKGLQRLRWYCQICQKQCRDENGFKQHTQSEGHVRAMLLVGEDPKKYIEDYSRQFSRDFLQLLKTSHGEKKVQMNQFYQEYIRDKEHVHMNATKWPSLTEFAKYLGREGICRVEEGGERGLEIQWIDDSPEAIRRREDVRRKERLAKGDEEMEARMLERQIRQAREQAGKVGRLEDPRPEKQDGADVQTDVEPVKVSLSLGSAKGQSKQQQQSPKEQAEDAPVEITTFSSSTNKPTPPPAPAQQNDDIADDETDIPAPQETQQPQKSSLSLSAAVTKPKPINPLMAKKSNPLSSSKKKDLAPPEPEKKMTNAERIMREEMEAKRKAQERFEGRKKQRIG